MTQCNIVLFEPEIPANTGNIARTCVGFNMRLHLIKPYGFDINEKTVKRAGLDYWKFLDLKEYDNFDEFLKLNKNASIFPITKFGNNLINEIGFNNRKNVYFLFGKETKGLPKEILEKYKDNSILIPIINIRSLNLSNVVAIIANNFQMENNYKGLDRIINR